MVRGAARPGPLLHPTPLTTHPAALQVFPLCEAGAVDTVLLLAVRAGFGGQKFNPAVLRKVAALRARFPGINIIVDGGWAGWLAGWVRVPCVRADANAAQASRRQNVMTPVRGVVLAGPNASRPPCLSPPPWLLPHSARRRHHAGQRRHGGRGWRQRAGGAQL